MITIGVGSWSLPWAVGFMKNTFTYPKIGAKELIDYAVSHQISLVQLYNNLNLIALSMGELQEIRAYADSKQVRIEIGDMGVDTESVEKLLQVADILDSHTIRSIILPYKGEWMDVPSVIDLIKGYIAEFERMGRVLLLETHEKYSAEEFRAIVEGVGSEALGMCFDPANSIGRVEHFRDNFHVLKDYVFNYHYKEYNIRRADTNLGIVVEGCCPGTGAKIAEEYFGLIKTLERDVDVILEQWLTYQGSVEETKQLERQWADEGVKILKSHFA
jgi:sugar phosphate isomerase/epimerase